MKIKKIQSLIVLTQMCFYHGKNNLKKITVRLFSSTDIVFSCSYHQFLNLFFLHKISNMSKGIIELAFKIRN